MACSTFHQGAFDRSLSNAPNGARHVGRGRLQRPDGADRRTPGVVVQLVVVAGELGARALRRVAGAAPSAPSSSGERNLYALSTAVQQRAMLHQLRHETECLHRVGRALPRRSVRTRSSRCASIQADIYKGWALGVSGSERRRARARGGRHSLASGMPVRRSTRRTTWRCTPRCCSTPIGLTTRSTSWPLRPTARPAAPTSTKSELCRLRARGLISPSAAPPLSTTLAGISTTAVPMAQRQGAVALELRTVIDRFELEAEHGDASRAGGVTSPVWLPRTTANLRRPTPCAPTACSKADTAPSGAVPGARSAAIFPPQTVPDRSSDET